MSLEPNREPITRPVFVWLEVAAHGDGEIADEGGGARFIMLTFPAT